MSVDRFCKREQPEPYPADMDWPTKKGLHVYTESGVKELQIKYPDVKICTSPKCEFTDYDHEVCYKYDQHNADMAKQGMIRIMFRVLDESWKTEKMFEWWNDKKWILLKQ